MVERRQYFRDRREAGRQLAVALERFKGDDPIILALPRGGAPVAFEVARALGAELDVLFVRKIGAPRHEELALGAIMDGRNPQLVLNEEIVAALAPPKGYIEQEAERQLAEIERRRRLYHAPAMDVKGRTVIVIDDGVATGATVKAALIGVKRNHPKRLILAVPVAPIEAVNDLGAECDEVVCLLTPEPFYAVGAHYADFTQTTDEEVMRLLAEARRRTVHT